MALTKQQQKDLQRLEQLRPIDDDFMRCLFKDNIPLAELVLRIITGKQDLIITDCETQKDMKRLAGARSVCLDAFELMAERTRYLKENPKGVSEMCKVMEDMRNETWNEATERVTLQSIKNLMETMKWSVDQAMHALKISEVEKIKYVKRL